jgi:hypothetical protein
MVGGSLWVLRLLPLLKLVACHDIAEILLKVALKHQKSIKSNRVKPKIVKLVFVASPLSI